MLAQGFQLLRSTLLFIYFLSRICAYNIFLIMPVFTLRFYMLGFLLLRSTKKWQDDQI